MTAVETAERNRQITALALEIREQLGEHNVLGELSRELAENRLRLSELARVLEGTQRELAAVRLTQKARDILMPRAALEYAGRTEIQVDSSAPLAAESGFHALERDGNGTAFRWTGPTPQFNYDLHLDRSSLLKFSLQAPLWGAEHAKNLDCSSDGMSLPLRPRTIGRMLVLEGILFPRPMVGMTRLVFKVDHLHVATPKTEGVALRELGMPVFRLKVMPMDDDEFQEWTGGPEAHASTGSEQDSANGALVAPKLAPSLHRDAPAGH
jgi:hypothetical protein